MRHRTLDRETSPMATSIGLNANVYSVTGTDGLVRKFRYLLNRVWRCHLILDQQWARDCRVHQIETGSCEEYLYVRHAARCGRRRRLARSNQAKKILGSGILSGPTKVRLARTPEEFAGIRHGAARYHVGDSWARAKSWADRSPCRQDRWR
jgi:hypothetical protein